MEFGEKILRLLSGERAVAEEAPIRTEEREGPVKDRGAKLLLVLRRKVTECHRSPIVAADGASRAVRRVR